MRIVFHDESLRAYAQEKIEFLWYRSTLKQAGEGGGRAFSALSFDFFLVALTGELSRACTSISGAGCQVHLAEVSQLQGSAEVLRASKM